MLSSLTLSIFFREWHRDRELKKEAGAPRTVTRVILRNVNSNVDDGKCNRGFKGRQRPTLFILVRG